MRYAVIDLDDELVDSAFSRAQELLAFPESLTSDEVKRYSQAGMVTLEQEATLGINFYIDEHSLRWQNDVGLLYHTRRDSNRTDYLVRSQIQIAF